MDEKGWKPIETAPRDGTRVLLANEELVDAGSYEIQWTTRSEFVRHAKDGDVYRMVKEDTGWWDTKAYCPLWWQPLPPLPEPPEVSRG